MLLYFAACLAPAFLISFVATAAMRKLAPKWGLVDRPSQRKTHSAPIPLGGGVGIWAGIVLPLAATQIAAFALSRMGELPSWFPAQFADLLDGVIYRSGRMWAIIAGGTILSVMGLIDDVRDLPWLPRLFVQFVVATALVLAGIRSSVFLPIPWLGSVLTVIWIMVLVNAFNFLDNMDGLSGGIGLIAASLFAVIMLRMTSEPRWLVGGVLLVMVGSLAGFLCHNRAPARIFMGDSGSYFIGLLMATMTVLGTFYERSDRVAGPHVILAPLCILAVPLYDFCSVVLIRLREGRSPFHADKSHFSHRLVELGLRPSRAVLTIYLATLTTGLGALLLYEVDDWSGAAIVVALIACVLAVVAILETVGRGKNGE